MKQLIITIAFATLSIFSNAQLNQIISEVYYSDDGTVENYPEGFTTYRIYALLENPSDFLSSVSGLEGNELTIGSSTNTIWNSTLGGVSGPDLNFLLFSTFPELEYDSYMTVGRANSNDPGAPIFVVETGSDLADGFGTSGEEDEFDTNVTVSDGLWFALNGDVNGLGLGDDNRVLLAQITTDGTLTYCLNVQVFPLGIGANSITYNNLCDTDISNGCMESGACNYDPFAIVDDGSCEYLSCLGCTDPMACNYDSSATEEDGSCEYLSCLGCTNQIACNYNSTATIDDDSCEYESCAGCMDSEACNYESTASINNLSCDYSCYGCTNPNACNYDSLVTFDDGTCDFESCAGCMDPIACNFDSTATLDNFLCEYQYCSGCLDTTASNYDSTATIDDESCLYCSADEEVITLDMIDSFGDGWNNGTYVISDDMGTVITSGTLESGDSGSSEFCLLAGCYTIEVGGGSADNEISWSLTNQEGVIVFSNQTATNGAAIGFSLNDTMCVIDGCTDADCNNYNPFATNDDGSCTCPPPNDDCENAIGIQDGDILLGTTINANDNEGFIGTSCGTSIDSPGVWYVYNGDGNQIIVETCNTMPVYDTRISLFEGSCGSLTCVAGNDDACEGVLSAVAFTSTVGVDIYILVHGANQSTGNFQLELNSTPCPAPENDECSNAQFINSNETITANLCCAQVDDANECTGDVTVYGLWYYFNVGDADGLYFDLSNVSGTNVGMTIYEEEYLDFACDALNPIACCGLITGTCAGDISAFYSIMPNSNFYLLVYTDDLINCGTFDLTISPGYLGCTDPFSGNYDPNATIDDGTCIWSNPPLNDDCSNAIPIACNTITSGSTGGALTGGPTDVLECETFTSPGVWYTFTGTGDLHNLSTCGSIEDTQVNVYISDDGTCTGTFSCVADGFGGFLSEIDDASAGTGCGFFDQDDVYLDFISQIDEIYYIFLSNGGNSGGHQITITCDDILEGCMDGGACNYDSSANVDDGTCDFFSCLCTECEPDSSYPVNMEMYDAFGDGWGGAVYEISDSFGNIIFSGSIDTAMSAIDNDGFFGNEYGNDWFCICGEECYSINVGGGDWDEEISWTLWDEFGNVLISGGATMNACFTLGDAVCEVGCTDSEACNYDSTALCDNLSCVYPGCIDSTACNYDTTAGCDDGSCLYEAFVGGYVFNDANQDGYFDGSGFDEPGLFNWQVEIVELGWSVFTTADGYYQFLNVPPGSYTIQISSVEDAWTATTNTSLNVATSTCQIENINFGFAGEGTSPFWLDGPCCIWSMDIHCENGFNPGLWINNTGSLPLNGTVTVSFDSILDAVPLIGNAVEPTDISPGIVTWDLNESPLGGESLLFQCHINGPGSEYLGDQFGITINVSLEDEGIEYYNNTWVLEPIVVCSYDPNDKYAAYEGYTEEHFILPDNSIEYRIRFQNTGNFAAEDITITDILDIERLDLETFQPMFGSHSYMTSVLADGQVNFVFEDIFLPDSASNEPGSQGYVVYRITPMEGIAPGEVINNTANIYFDSNPAIVTNTTWHTIMDCEPVPEFTMSSEQLCLGEMLSLETTSDYAEEVTWFVDEVEMGNGNSIGYTAPEAGAYQIDVEVSNPLCNEMSTQTLTVNPLPTATFIEDGVILTASAGSSYQWYLNGNPIDGATDQTWEALENGDYSVEVTNEFNCSDVSDEITVIVIGVEELNNIELSIYPNPIRETATLFFGVSGEAYDVQIISTSGQLVRSYENITDNTLTLEKSDIASGTYVLRVMDRQSNSSRELKIVFE